MGGRPQGTHGVSFRPRSASEGSPARELLRKRVWGQGLEGEGRGSRFQPSFAAVP